MAEVLPETVEMQVVEIENESYLKISSVDRMRPFLMSLVSDSDHWMFIASNGGLTAGRKNPEYALFPYYTDDKIIDSADMTGSKSIFQIRVNDEILVWEPFSERYTGKYTLSRNLYKSIHGNKIIFEEINHDLKLVFRYRWNSSGQYGFVRMSEFFNLSGREYTVSMVDGIQNLMPAGVHGDLQRSVSNLVDAYKRAELEPETGLGIFALSAMIVDKAEPAEALKANIAWSFGLPRRGYLLSSLQLNKFRNNQAVVPETDIKGEKGSYFVVSENQVAPNSSLRWGMVANVNQRHSQIVELCLQIRENPELEQLVHSDIEKGVENLVKLVAAADGLQSTADHLNDARHYSNVLFNIMRGGIFDNNYTFDKSDLLKFLEKANKEVLQRNQGRFEHLENNLGISVLTDLILKSDDRDLIRLCIEYLPLKFSRRHGDPSRPWNYFNINTFDETTGSKVLDYEGNWRDVFQNWEALAMSYPEFLNGMIFRFLNASTFDGYNPYRITRDGFDWETIEPDNPWSYIGYWGDHQVIYLLKFLELMEKFHPGTLTGYFDKEWFVYAAVPYRIRPYPEILSNPKDTIAFDHSWDQAVRNRRDVVGADGALLCVNGHDIYHVNMMEKLLAMMLAKVTNFIPEAGIWMNTQRPEWNDANNALVGNGVSVVTLNYLYRFMKFFREILNSAGKESFQVSRELSEYFHKVYKNLVDFAITLQQGFDDGTRKSVMDGLGMASSDYRQLVYNKGFTGEKCHLPVSDLKQFAGICLEYFEQSIQANKRQDHLYHSYNILSITASGASHHPLSEMLEGQVAALSSGFLSSSEALRLMDALKNSALYRKDQNSYILYPDKELPGFLQKNRISADDVNSSELIRSLIKDGNKDIVEQDVLGDYHFNGSFKNANDLIAALHSLTHTAYKELVENDREQILQIFEKVFNHKAFTGRSGTFYSYEGLGSIYWHMVSKLHLALQECFLDAVEEDMDADTIAKLKAHYYEVKSGLGVHKSPEWYGAFPTDPYSHTPKHRGAQQPGMTGQVKEDILVHFSELGVVIRNGKISFHPVLLKPEDFLTKSQRFDYYTVTGEISTLAIDPGQLGFTFCQLPVIYSLADADQITMYYPDGSRTEIPGNTLDPKISQHIFQRSGLLQRVVVSISKSVIFNNSDK